METTIVLTMAELKRVEVIQRVFRGEVTMAEAASLDPSLFLSCRDFTSLRPKERDLPESSRSMTATGYNVLRMALILSM